MFNILKEHSIELWKQQMEIIMGKHGLISFIVHPDYIVGPNSVGSTKHYSRICVVCRKKMASGSATPGDVSRLVEAAGGNDAS